MHFLKDFPYRFSWQNYRTAILKKTFSITTLPVAVSIYAKNVLKKTKEVNILKVWTESFTSRASRTLAAYKMDFILTLAVSWKLEQSIVFLEHILSKTCILIKLAVGLLIFPSSL